MARQSECEHDIGFYRVTGGEGLDVVEDCSICNTRITSESPKTQFKREQEEKKEKKQAAKERKEEKKEAREAEEEKSYTKETKKDKYHGDVDSIKYTSKEYKPKKSFWR